MKTIRTLLACVLAVQLTGGSLHAEFEKGYRVGAGDTLYIDFPLQGTLEDLRPLAGNGLSLLSIGNVVYWRHQVVVAPDGYIMLPALGPVKVEGQTLQQIRETLVDQLEWSPKKKYVSVVLAQANSNSYFIWGEVSKPGRFAFQRNTSLLQAVGEAGGFTGRANERYVMLVRPGEPTQTIDLSNRSLEKGSLPLIDLQPNDSIVVPRKWWAPDSFTTTMFLVLSAITTAATVAIAADND